MNDCTLIRLTRRACLMVWAVALQAACTAVAPDTKGFKDTLPRSVAEQPEGPSGIQSKSLSHHRQQAVATAHPLATEAGVAMLRAGGSAIDAAIAAQMVLALVEPQSSGLGGGAFVLHHDGRKVQAFDGRETAPRAVREDLFLGPDGQPMPFAQALVGGRSVGVPGVVAMLALVHQQHGRLPWASLFEPAIMLAERGFPVSHRLHALLTTETALRDDPVARRYFYGPDGQAHPVGHRLQNPELVVVLRALAREGPMALHEGPVAQAIVRTVREHATNPGMLDEEDLRTYLPREREPLCTDHDAAHRRLRICGFPPPSSGALAVAQILGMLAHVPAARAPLQGAPEPAWLHAYMEVSRLAFADRAHYVADPDYVEAPGGYWQTLTAPDYLASRASLVGERRAARVDAGLPPGTLLTWAPMPDQPEKGTSHLSVVDRHGNALAMTTTIESGFGARLMVSTEPSRPGGFLLNNQLTDFSFAPADARGRRVANRVEPGKRPRSSMAPTLVFDRDSGQLLMSTGSPGGALIIHYIAKVLLGALHGGLDPQAAINLPNFGTTGAAVLLEERRFPPGTARALEQRGHTVSEVPLTSGLQALQKGTMNGQAVWLGGADPRREGVVAGD